VGDVVIGFVLPPGVDGSGFGAAAASRQENDCSGAACWFVGEAASESGGGRGEGGRVGEKQKKCRVNQGGGQVLEWLWGGGGCGKRGLRRQVWCGFGR
jgi:hypothetical protein